MFDYSFSCLICVSKFTTDFASYKLPNEIIRTFSGEGDNWKNVGNWPVRGITGSIRNSGRNAKVGDITCSLVMRKQKF